MKKIILSADSTCDLPINLREKLNIQIIPLYINLNGKEYRDSVDIFPDDIYNYYNEHKILPKTAAPSIGDFLEHFRKWDKETYEIIHISIGSGISASYQNATLAANELGNVYVVDSNSLTTGSSILLLKADEFRQKGISAKEIYEHLRVLNKKVNASFVINSLTYLREGGRLSALQAFGANVLGIKPCIEVKNEKHGQMEVGNKYRGNLSKVHSKYTQDRLKDNSNIDTSRIFLTHSGISDENIDFIKTEIEKYQQFDEIIIARAGCTISSHCGENTIGLIYLDK